MTTPHSVTVLAAFLCTYAIHSTLLPGPVWWLAGSCRWLGDPGLQSKLLKWSMVAPLLTAFAVTVAGGPHWGLRLPLEDSAVLTTSEDHQTAAGFPSSLSGGRESGTASLESPGTAVPEFMVSPDAVPARTFAATEPRTAFATRPSFVSESSSVRWPTIVYTGVLVWSIVAMLGLFRLAIQWTNLQRLRTTANAIADRKMLDELEQLTIRLGIHRSVELLQSNQTEVPLAAGILCPFVVFPANRDRARPGEAACDFSAMLAHELAHVARGDALWNLLLQVICRVGFFQPLNWLISRAIRQQMDFCADSMAAEVLGERMSLVRCLYQVGTRLKGHCAASPAGLVLASGMALFQSTLGQRVEALLNPEQNPPRPTSITKTAVLLLTLLGSVSVSLLSPRAAAEAASSSQTTSNDRSDNMNKSLASVLVLAGLSIPVMSDEPKSGADNVPVKSVELNATPDELPAGIHRFNGMLVGRVAARDPEQGTFTVLVDAVPRVWENSKAEDPRSIVGKTVSVSGVFGKFLDVLVVTRIGETVEFECKHDGEGLVFPGELLRKVGAYDPADYPVLPEEFRGFRGQVSAEILKKDPETFELLLRVDQVLKTWEDSSARNPKSIEGKSLMLAGFWNRRDAYHDLKAGDRIDVGMKHIGMRSDHLTVAGEVRKTKSLSDRPTNGEDRALVRREETEQKDPQRGFRGMLVGRLIEKDAERGTFTITVDAVPRVWENNRSASPKSLIGRNVAAEGVTGRMIDALVVSKIGDTIEFGALHEDGPRVRVGEVLRKVAPVKPGDYPVLPDEFRGFRGVVTAKVIRKGDELWELIVEVEKVHETFDGNRSKQPQSIVGRQLMLAGFWNRKEEFHNIRVGDRIRCGMNHTQLLSDHLTVVESVRKVEDSVEKE